MSAGHSFTEPRDPFGFWRDAEPDAVGMDVYCVMSSASDLARLPGAMLAPSLPELIEARETLNDAIAKAEAHCERAGMARLPFTNLN